MAELPPPVIDRIEREMAERDPGADASVALTCHCGMTERRFDIGAYLWDEVDDWASAGECTCWPAPMDGATQILALSSARRRTASRWCRDE